jgi:hypothetical protein
MQTHLREPEDGFFVFWGSRNWVEIGSFKIATAEISNPQSR